MSTLATIGSEPIAALRALLLRHGPLGHARMTEPGLTAKYLRHHTAIADADLAAHLAGDLTLACVLQRDGLAYAAAVDIDSGGVEALRRVMRAAEQRACHAYGFALDSGAHSGGHVWVFFAEPHDPRHLQALMRDIVFEADCPDAEVYPSGADLRLPFGRHRRCGRRGELLLSSGAYPLDLDADLAGGLAAFLTSVRLTGERPVALTLAAQETRRAAVAEAIAVARPRPIAPDAPWREVIAHFNRSTDLVALLEGYGARVAYRGRGGKVLLHCACAHDHARGDARPSLVVEPGRGRQQGMMICGCYTPSCRLHNLAGQVMDPFEVFARMEGITKREAVARLQGAGGGERREARGDGGYAALQRPASVAHQPPQTPPPPPIAPEILGLQAIIERLAADRRAQPLDRRLFGYIVAQGEEAKGLANAALAAALGARVDSVKRAKRRLRDLGYIAVTISTDGRSPSVVTVLPPPTGGAAEGGGESELPPPSHVSINTCIVETPPPVSNDAPAQPTEQQAAIADPPQEAAPQAPQRALAHRSERELRKRRGVLIGMLRAGQPERRRFVLSIELAAIDTELAERSTHIRHAEEPQTPAADADTGARYTPEAPHSLVSTSGLRLALSDEPHPALSDEQITALLRDLLRDRVMPVHHPLLKRVSWRRFEGGLALVCAPRDLVPATTHLLALSRRALTELDLPESSEVRVQVGRPQGAAAYPGFIDGLLWTRVPVWMRPLLVGASLVDGCLYGATPEQTAALGAYDEAVIWLLDSLTDQGQQRPALLAEQREEPLAPVSTG